MIDLTQKRDVTEIIFRANENEYRIPVFNMTREEAITVKELIAKQPQVTYTVAYVIGGNTI